MLLNQVECGIAHFNEDYSVKTDQKPIDSDLKKTKDFMMKKIASAKNQKPIQLSRHLFEDYSAWKQIIDILTIF